MAQYPLEPINILEAFTTSPPPLDYVLPNMVAGTVGAIVSPGGTGKSMLALQLAMQIAGGPDLLGLGAMPTGQVVYLPAEDPPVAIIQRMYALGTHLSTAQQQSIADGLLIQPLIGLNPNILSDDWFSAIERIATGRRLLILDTYRRFHFEDENASGPMVQVIGCLEAIATGTGCTIVFLHHTNKGAALAGAGDMQQASRGSSVLVDNIRWQSYLAGMTIAEADKWGITRDRRGYFVRFGLSKANYGSPFEERWFHRNGGGVLMPALELRRNSLRSVKSVNARGDDDAEW
ncbi:MAG: helicase RepA family protein [Candidatus Sedimenticola sp. 6PFRAG5]